jgi:cytoskeletal protein CcmA (bactofilin family)
MFNGKGSASTSPTGEGLTVIGSDARFHGDLQVKGALRVEGTVEGDISDASVVEIGVKGKVKGSISAEKLSVAGEVTGDVTVSGSVELLKDSCVRGVIRVPRLRIDDGAKFDGECAMSSDPEKRAEGARRSAGREPVSTS